MLRLNLVRLGIQGFKVLPRILTVCAFLFAAVLEFVLLLQLAMGPSSFVSGFSWMFWHVIGSALGAAAMSLLLHRLLSRSLPSCMAFCFPLSFCIPFMGLFGGTFALYYGISRSLNMHKEEVYWQFTDNADLPFATPIKREVVDADSRGFSEQLIYSKNYDDLYRKVLAAANIRASLSVDTLKTAIKHPDERIRLTAYQSLDKKVNHLNKEIQRLESASRGEQGQDKSNTWLQIASNYWELLELEKDEPIARKQLLEKAASAARHSITIMRSNRNAHFTLGRISLLQGEYKDASEAFAKSIEHGMPAEKAMPYMAEASFKQRDFREVKRVLKSIDSAFKKYPPLKNVAEYWV